MAHNNPGNGDVPPPSLIRATLQPEAMANSPASYAFDYTRNCYTKGGDSISAREVCTALAERDALRAEVERLREVVRNFLDSSGQWEEMQGIEADARAALGGRK